MRRVCHVADGGIVEPTDPPFNSLVAALAHNLRARH